MEGVAPAEPIGQSLDSVEGELEAVRATVDAARQVFADASAYGLRETPHTPQERDYRFDQDNFPEYRMRFAVTQNLSPNFRLEVSETKIEPESQKRSVRQERITASSSGAEAYLVSLVRDGRPLFELNQLLPTGVRLEPRESGVESWAFSREEPGYPKVCYRDLSTNEDFYVFLHEVAHSWQSRFRPTQSAEASGAKRTIAIARRFSTFTHYLGRVDGGEDPASIPELVEESETTKTSLPALLEGMRSFIVRYEGDLARDRVTVSASGITVDPESPLRENLRSLVDEERQAWAMAARVYRIMEKGGLVLNPEQGIDLAKKANESLATYQEAFGGFASALGERNFTRKA